MTEATLGILSDDKQSFEAALKESARVLDLGRALSAGRLATFSAKLSDSEGFFLAPLAPEKADDPAEAVIVTADSQHNAPFTAASPLHAAIYAAQPRAGAVAVVRGQKLAIWAAARRPLPVRYFQMLGYTKAHEIPTSQASADALRTVVEGNPESPAVLLDNGDVVIWSRDVAKLTRLILSLEEAAHVTALAERLGGAKPYPDAVRTLIQNSLHVQARLA